jgi:hypothetical protein
MSEKNQRFWMCGIHVFTSKMLTDASKLQHHLGNPTEVKTTQGHCCCPVVVTLTFIMAARSFIMSSNLECSLKAPVLKVFVPTVRRWWNLYEVGPCEQKLGSWGIWGSQPLPPHVLA